MRKTNYERYLERRLKDRRFRELYEQDCEAASLAVQIREMRRRRGWTQGELARRIGTTQSAIARLENAEYEGYTVHILRRLARAAGWRLEIRLQPGRGGSGRRRTATA